jgi:hypothetical protein
MKKAIMIAALAMSSFGANAQIEVDGTTINDIDIEYVELVGRQKFLSLKIKVFVDYGQDFSWKQQTIRGADGKNMAFNSMVDALNFMNENGYEYVNNYLVQTDNEVTYRYLLRKKKD